MVKTIFNDSVNSSANEKLCTWLKNGRKSQVPKVTLRTVGSLINSPHTLPSKIENGKRRIDVVEFVLYCNAIGLDPMEGLKVVQKELLVNPK